MKRSLRERISALGHSGATNREIAFGIALGVFVSFSPLYGVQLLICLMLVLIFKRLNKAAVFIGVQASWFYPPMLYLDYVTGRWLLPGDYPTLDVPFFKSATARAWVMMKQIFHAFFFGSYADLNGEDFQRFFALAKLLFPVMLVGSLIAGAAAGAVAYILAMLLMKKFRVQKSSP